MTVPDDFARFADRVAAEFRRRVETVHERVACPKCGVRVGVRCKRVSATTGEAVIGSRALKHPHGERLRADGIAER